MKRIVVLLLFALLFMVFTAYSADIGFRTIEGKLLATGTFASNINTMTAITGKTTDCQIAKYYGLEIVELSTSAFRPVLDEAALFAINSQTKLKMSVNMQVPAAMYDCTFSINSTVSMEENRGSPALENTGNHEAKKNANLDMKNKAPMMTANTIKTTDVHTVALITDLKKIVMRTAAPTFWAENIAVAKIADMKWKNAKAGLVRPVDNIVVNNRDGTTLNYQSEQFATITGGQSMYPNPFNDA